jgi:hypothetical protein
MRIRTLLASAAAGATLVVPAGASGAEEPPLRVTFVGDSVPAALSYVAGARAVLRDGLAVRLDLKVCRRLVAASCRHGGGAPTTALEAVRRYGSSLGGVLIVDVGYNEDGRGYRAGIDEVMRAALGQGATRVIWVTLRETDPVYRGANAAIADAARRWPELRVADWNAYSRGKPWFRDDGLHLTAAGADELAAFLRARVLEASRAAAR